MNITFKVENRKPYKDKIDKLLWERAEDAIKSNIKNKLNQISNSLQGLSILITIDLGNGKAVVSSDNIPEDKLNIINEAFKTL